MEIHVSPAKKPSQIMQDETHLACIFTSKKKKKGQNRTEEFKPVLSFLRRHLHAPSKRPNPSRKCERHQTFPGTLRHTQHKDHLPTPLALCCCGSSVSRPLLSLRNLTKWKRSNTARLAMLCVTDNNPKWADGDVEELLKKRRICRLYIATWGQRFER